MSLLQKTAGGVSRVVGRESWLIRRLRPAYESFLGLSSNGLGIPWDINGVNFRIDPRYRRQLGHDYDAPVAAFIRERVAPGAVCFDVGANVGVYVLQFAHWAGERGRVFAFEPNPAARAVLRKHVELNGLTRRVEIVPAAVGAAGGDGVLFTAGADGMSRLGSPNQLIAEVTTPVSVPVVTLDEFCAARDLKPDWLFIDIEGFEIAALSGARETVKRCGSDLNVVVEMHPNVWSSADTTRARAEELLTVLGLRAVPLTGQSDPLGEYGLVFLQQRGAAAREEGGHAGGEAIKDWLREA